MKIACFALNEELYGSDEIVSLFSGLESGGIGLCRVADSVPEDTDMILSIGGDGTFLAASALALKNDIPVLGVNQGRLGFLSENSAATVLKHILSSTYRIEDRCVLKVGCSGKDWEYPALNEVAIHRTGAGTIGVDVLLDGKALPTYWGDGVLVATVSGSTAYNLSVGGPICAPGADVLIITPIAPHNLGVRPLVIPDSSNIELRLKCREDSAELNCDNHSETLPSGSVVRVEASAKRLKRVVFEKSNFIDALCSRFFWGQDVRNSK